MKTAPDTTHRNSKKLENLDELLKYVKEKRDQGFWGEVWVKFRNGVPYLIEEIRSISVPNFLWTTPNQSVLGKCGGLINCA